MNSGRGMPPLLTTKSWILRSICRMLSTSVRTLSHSFSTIRAEKRICISSAEIFFCRSRYFGALWPSFCKTASMRVKSRRIVPKRSSAATFRRSRFSLSITPGSVSSSSSSISSASSSIAVSSSLKSSSPSTPSSIFSSSLEIWSARFRISWTVIRQPELARRDVVVLAVLAFFVGGVFGALAGDLRGDFTHRRLLGRRGLLVARCRDRYRFPVLTRFLHGCRGLDRLRRGLGIRLYDSRLRGQGFSVRFHHRRLAFVRGPLTRRAVLSGRLARRRFAGRLAGGRLARRIAMSRLRLRLGVRFTGRFCGLSGHDHPWSSRRRRQKSTMGRRITVSRWPRHYCRNGGGATKPQIIAIKLDICPDPVFA